MQKTIIHDLQCGTSVTSPIASQAQDLSDKALAAKGMSHEACQLRASLLSRTGHAKVRPGCSAHYYASLNEALQCPNFLLA